MKKPLILLFCLFSLGVCSAQVIETFAGNGLIGFSGDHGAATAAEVRNPSGVVADKQGNVFFCDQNASCIRKVDTAGIITSVAGNSGVAGYMGDGGPATAAELFWPEGVALDDSGDLFIADQFNNVIRKVTLATGIITTIAGDNALVGFGGDGAPATNAALHHPTDVGVDHRGNVYFVDQDNSAMRKVDVVTGIITTVAGVDTAGYGGDGGPASNAKLNFPEGIAVDSAGNVFIADFYNSRIRKVDAVTGIITTVAGTDTSGFSGDGGPATAAELFYASAVAVDDTGNIYISDYGNARIRKVAAATGIITTVGGNGTAAYCCDCEPATEGEMYFPEGVAVDKKGNIYIADFGNSRVRVITNHFVCPALAVAQASVTASVVFPNPSTGIFSIRTPVPAQITVFDEMGKELYSNKLLQQDAEIDLSGYPTGVYFLKITNASGSSLQKLILAR